MNLHKASVTATADLADIYACSTEGYSTPTNTILTGAKLLNQRYSFCNFVIIGLAIFFL